MGYISKSVKPSSLHYPALLESLIQAQPPQSARKNRNKMGRTRAVNTGEVQQVNEKETTLSYCRCAWESGCKREH